MSRPPALSKTHSYVQVLLCLSLNGCSGEVAILWPHTNWPKKPQLLHSTTQAHCPHSFDHNWLASSGKRWAVVGGGVFIFVLVRHLYQSLETWPNGRPRHTNTIAKWQFKRWQWQPKQILTDWWVEQVTDWHWGWATVGRFFICS